MSASQRQSKYTALQQQARTTSIRGRDQEGTLDALLVAYQEKRERERETVVQQQDPIDELRVRMTQELIPAFRELAEKYAERGVSLKLDASLFLSGERELQVELAFDGIRVELHGTVTTEAIAFRQIRYEGDLGGQLASGPALRVRTLDASRLREFVCERLAMLVRSALCRRSANNTASRANPGGQKLF